MEQDLDCLEGPTEFRIISGYSNELPCIPLASAPAAAVPPFPHTFVGIVQCLPGSLRLAELIVVVGYSSQQPYIAVTDRGGQGGNVCLVLHFEGRFDPSELSISFSDGTPSRCPVFLLAHRICKFKGSLENFVALLLLTRFIAFFGNRNNFKNSRGKRWICLDQLQSLVILTDPGVLMSNETQSRNSKARIFDKFRYSNGLEQCFRRPLMLVGVDKALDNRMDHATLQRSISHEIDDPEALVALPHLCECFRQN